ncbi:MAG: NAD-dependent epimerase/dehydratase family protein [Bdellovibrionota bacterium]
MRAFVTGATGFLGGKLVGQLRAEGQEVIALVRSPEKAAHLKELGIEIAKGDVTEPGSLPAPMKGVDAVYHVAAWYELGVDDAEKMQKINVEGTKNVLETAAAANIPRIVYCSSVAALGTTGGQMADETHQHKGDFGSHYERTKHEAHEYARRLAKRGAPVLIGSPGTIYGPGDTSLVPFLLKAHLRKQLVVSAFPGTYMSLVYVDDCATGLRLVAEKGKTGGEYNLVGEVIRLDDWFKRLSEITGIPPPRFSIPASLVRAGARFFPLVAGALRMAPGTARDGLAMADGKSWMFSSERARNELGWKPSDFDEAMARTLIALDRHGGERFRPTTDRGRKALERARGKEAA